MPSEETKGLTLYLAADLWAYKDLYRTVYFCADVDPRIAELEAELQDWRDGHQKILAEDCPTDEQHCACVPGLRKRVAELEAENARVREIVKVATDALQNYADLGGTTWVTYDCGDLAKAALKAMEAPDAE